MAFDPRGKSMPHQSVYADMLSDGLKLGKFMQFGIGGSHPQLMQYGTQASPVTVPTFPTAAQDNIGSMVIPHAAGSHYIEYYSTTAQTLHPSLNATKGYEIALDQVNNESVEYVIGGNSAVNPMGQTLGTSPNIYLGIEFEITDASGMDQFGIFFRKQEAYAVPTSFLTTGDPIYTDIVLFGFATAVADPNPLAISYDFNNSGSATVFAPNFTWADGLRHKLEMWISQRYVKFAINGVPLGGRVSKDAAGNTITAQNTLTPPAAIRFDSGDFIVPGIFCRQDTDVTPVYVRNLVCGQLLEISRDAANRTT